MITHKFMLQNSYVPEQHQVHISTAPPANHATISPLMKAVIHNSVLAQLVENHDIV